jgi:phosphate starvation-inducible membrane PsiE
LQYELEPVLRSDITSIETLLTAILNVLLVIAVPIIVFFIIFAGFTYVTAQGNPEKIKTATRSLTYAIIGAVLILGGVAISEIIASVVSSFQT